MRRRTLMAVCVLVGAGVLAGQPASFGQDDLFGPPPRGAEGRRIKNVEGGRYGPGAPGFEKRIEWSGRPDAMHEIHEAAAKLRDAEGDDGKRAAAKELTELLDRYFEDDMKRRQEELARVEQRVTKLRELLDKRKDKKQEIIDLQVKVLENEADGLGFFHSAPPGGGDLFMYAPGQAMPLTKGGAGYGGIGPSQYLSAPGGEGMIAVPAPPRLLSAPAGVPPAVSPAPTPSPVLK